VHREESCVEEPCQEEEVLPEEVLYGVSVLSIVQTFVAAAQAMMVLVDVGIDRWSVQAPMQDGVEAIVDREEGKEWNQNIRQRCDALQRPHDLLTVPQEPDGVVEINWREALVEQEVALIVDIKFNPRAIAVRNSCAHHFQEKVGQSLYTLSQH